MLILNAKLRLRRGSRRLGKLFGKTQFCFAEKTAGVEPGFRAIDLNPPFFQELLIILKSKPDEPGYIKLIGKLEPGDLKQQQIAFASFIRRRLKVSSAEESLAPELRCLCEELSLAVARNEQLTSWMYKLDYVVGQKYRIKANKSAIREYVGTRLANVFSSKNQKQELVWIAHEKEAYALLACAWKNNLQELKHFLYNGSEPDYCGILVDDPKAEVKFSKYIPELGINLIFNLAIGDKDCIGKDARNKGFVNGAYFGYDYGKTCKGGRVCTTLKEDFSFDDWAAKTPSFLRGSSFFGLARHYIYRNFSVFYDTSLLERMMGVHILKKMISGKNPGEEIIESYSGLEQRLEHIDAAIPSPGKLLSFLSELRERCAKNHELGCLVDKYINLLKQNGLIPFDLYFIEIELELFGIAFEMGIPLTELEEYLTFIEGMKVLIKKNNEGILTVFNQRLTLTSNQIDLLDKLEKIFSPTSVLSQDGRVFLNTMRFNPPGLRIPFQLIHLSDGNYKLFTSEPSLARRLKRKFGLLFLSGDSGISCMLTEKELMVLVEKVELAYHQKREALLVRPTYEMVIIPNLYALLNENNVNHLKASIDFSLSAKKVVELILIPKTAEQINQIQNLFNLQTAPLKNKKLVIHIQPQDHLSYQKVIAKALLEKKLAKASLSLKEEVETYSDSEGEQNNSIISTINA